MLLKQSTAVVIQFGPFLDKTDGVALEVGLVSALDHASTGILLSKNGGTQTIRSATVTASTYDAHGCYKVTLNTTDTNTLGSLRVIYTDATICLPVWQDFHVVAANIYDSLVGGGDVLDVSLTQVNGAATTATLDTIKSDTAAVKVKTDFLPSATAGAAGGVFIAGTNAATSITTALTADITGNLSGSVGSVTGAVGSVTGMTASDVGAIKAKTDALPTDPADQSLIIAATDAVMARLGAPAGASVSADVAAVKTDTAAVKTKTDQLTFTGSNRVDSNVAAVNNNTGGVAGLERATRAITVGTIGAGSTTTSIVSSALTPAGSATDQFKGQIMAFDKDTTTANLRGQKTDITANTGSATPTFTVTALTHAPVSGDTFTIE